MIAIKDGDRDKDTDSETDTDIDTVTELANFGSVSIQRKVTIIVWITYDISWSKFQQPYTHVKPFPDKNNDMQIFSSSSPSAPQMMG